ncbi:MAG: UDP-glucose 4-epimerase GalE [Saprospiraceae bacterium]|jgi:UDP-glucose 4-epimerase
MAKVLVTGGCGFIGSHTLVSLINNGYDVISIDDNSRSTTQTLDGVEAITGVKVKNYKVDLCDFDKTAAVFEENPDISGVIHFAAYKSVMESVSVPLMYHRNNLNGLLNILECIKKYNVKSFVFSSSCSVYGNIETLPVTEDTPFKEAECPYARTKQIGEFIIRDFAKANPKINSIVLRYFNPAGAHPSGKLGEISWGKPIYLVPVITDTALGKREKMTVFGADYDTRDGSCVRDFIHVMDLADAHTNSLEFAANDKGTSNCETFNLGIGEGVTVLEAILAFEKTSGLKLNYEIGDRRDGDVVAIYAEPSKAFNVLGFKPQYTIEDIMKTAWEWDRKRS